MKIGELQKRIDAKTVYPLDSEHGAVIIGEAKKIEECFIER